MTEAEYLACDAANEGKHEFFDGYLVPWNGEILGMAGGSPEHSLLGMSISSALLGAKSVARSTPTSVYAYHRADTSTQMPPSHATRSTTMQNRARCSIRYSS